MNGLNHDDCVNPVKRLYNALHLRLVVQLLNSHIHLDRMIQISRCITTKQRVSFLLEINYVIRCVFMYRNTRNSKARQSYTIGNLQKKNPLPYKSIGLVSNQVRFEMY